MMWRLVQTLCVDMFYLIRLSFSRITNISSTEFRAETQSLRPQLGG